MINTTHGKALDAYAVLIKTAGILVDIRSARKLFELRKELQKSFEFYSERQNAIVAECGGTIAPDGLISFPEGADSLSYREKIGELNNLELEVNADVIEISEQNLSGYTPADLWNLDGFVRITD